MKRCTFMLVAWVWVSQGANANDLSQLFAPAADSPIAVGRGSGRVFLVDVNRDGHLDLVATRPVERRIEVLVGNGKGSFAEDRHDVLAFDYPLGAIAIGDINNDGFLDIGVTRKDDKNEYVHLRIGDGTGRFTEVGDSTFVIDKAVQGYKPILDFVDINEDGNADIVTSNGRRATLDILFGDGAGNFARGPKVQLAPNQDRYTCEIGDVDGDGHRDLVVVSSTESGGRPARVDTKLGDGKGGFTDASKSAISVATGSQIRELADMNGDGRLDIILNPSETSELAILLNAGNGSFRLSADLRIDLETSAFAVVAADVDRDKDSDLVVATVENSAAPYESKVAVLLADGDRFVSAPGSPYAAGAGAYQIAVADVDEDGKLDVVASSFEGNAVTLLLGR